MEKACTNCKHFIQFYIIANAKLRKAGNGHCSYKYINGKSRKTDAPCGEWTEKPDIFHEKSFRQILEKIAKSLEDLMLIVNKKD